jgi:phosphoglycolate phosphatase-like HAD superfamily hydrolase
MLGDILDDVDAGHRAGCRSILLDTGNETEWLRTEEREPDYSAKSFMEAVGFILAHTNAMDIPQKSGLIGGT